GGAGQQVPGPRQQQQRGGARGGEQQRQHRNAVGGETGADGGAGEGVGPGSGTARERASGLGQVHRDRSLWCYSRTCIVRIGTQRARPLPSRRSRLLLAAVFRGWKWNRKASTALIGASSSRLRSVPCSSGTTSIYTARSSPSSRRSSSRAWTTRRPSC